MNWNILHRKVFSEKLENSKIRKIYLFGSTTGQSLKKNIFLRRVYVAPTSRLRRVYVAPTSRLRRVYIAPTSRFKVRD